MNDLVKKKMAGTLEAGPDREILGNFERRHLTSQLAGLLDSLIAERKAPRQNSRREDVSRVPSVTQERI